MLVIVTHLCNFRNQKPGARGIPQSQGDFERQSEFLSQKEGENKRM